MGNKELKLFILFLFVSFLFYLVPLHHVCWQYAILEGLFLVQEYAREHILFCLVPALFIAGAISCFVSQTAVLKYFGAKANKILSYSLASIVAECLFIFSLVGMMAIFFDSQCIKIYNYVKILIF